MDRMENISSAKCKIFSETRGNKDQYQATVKKRQENFLQKMAPPGIDPRTFGWQSHTVTTGLPLEHERHLFLMQYITPVTKRLWLILVRLR